MSLEEYTENEREALLRFTKHTFIQGWEMNLRGELLYDSVTSFIERHPQLTDPLFKPDVDPEAIDHDAIRAAYYTHTTLYLIEQQTSEQS